MSGRTGILLLLLAALPFWSAWAGLSPGEDGNGALPAGHDLPYSLDVPQGAGSSGLSPQDRKGTRTTQKLGPTLILLDSIVLQETRRSYIGNPMVMFLGPDSSLYVVDSFGQSVIRFDRTGQQIRRYGRGGEGPGEFVAAGRAGFASSTVLGVTDGRSSGPPGMAPNQVIEFFDTESGDHLGAVRTTNVSFLALQGDTIWLAGIDVGTWRTLATRELSPLWRGASEGRGADIVVSMNRVPVPRSYQENSQVRGLGGFVRMHVGNEDAIVGFAAVPFLLRATAAGDVVDTIPLQARLRASVNDETELMQVMDPALRSLEEIFTSVAPLLGVSRDGKGHVFTVHQDSKLVGERGQPQIVGRLYASSLRDDGSDQCPDTEIPTSDVGRPISTFRGDEIFVLDRRIHDVDAGDLRTVVRRFKIDPSSCTGEIRRTGD